MIYSSLFYRCLETLRPSVEAFQKLGWKGKVRGETGVGEWFGSASFEQPAPGHWEVLRGRFFPWLEERESRILPNRYGESLAALHDRVARALEMIVSEVDKEYKEKGRGADDITLLICGHAAGIIASGRALTGRMPTDYTTEDFNCFTCGLSHFRRKVRKPAHLAGEDMALTPKNGMSDGVAGGWDCVLNSSCEHLSQGAERGWHFLGEELFDSYGPCRGSSREEKGMVGVEDTNEEDGSSKL